jgi:hypothetical protein
VISLGLASEETADAHRDGTCLRHDFIFFQSEFKGIDRVATHYQLGYTS